MTLIILSGQAKHASLIQLMADVRNIIFALPKDGNNEGKKGAVIAYLSYSIKYSAWEQVDDMGKTFCCTFSWQKVDN